MISVLTLDHHPLMRAGIEAILRSQPDIDPVGAAAHQRELWPLLSATEPDIVLLGASEASIAPLLPDLGGVGIARSGAVLQKAAIKDEGAGRLGFTTTCDVCRSHCLRSVASGRMRC